MKTKSNPYEPRHAVGEAPRIKTVGLRFGASDQDLEAKVKVAFDLAKSAGHELNLTFGAGETGPRAPGAPNPQ